MLQPGLLSAAPHRLLFLVGAAQLMLAMTWWTAWLAAASGWIPELAAPGAPPGWLHALLMQFQVFPSFMFGFLMTVFPRWMNQQAVPRALFLPTGIGLAAGQVLVLLGAWGVPAAGIPLVFIGVITTLIAWCVGLVALWRPLWGDAARTPHAVSAFAGMFVGAGGVLAFALFLGGGDPRWVLAAIKLGTFGLLLPVYLTVLHRMLPFFAAGAVRGHVPWRTPPAASLGVVWVLCLAHLLLELVHYYAWLWVVDLPFAAVTAWWLWRNWPRGPMPSLMRVLLVGAAWIPLALLLYAGQSAWFAWTGEFAMGRAPAHALFIGAFGSVLVAMVTRVTHGHSGRPLSLGVIPAIAFIGLQLAAVMRLAGEWLGLEWQALAALAWLLALAPWILRSGAIYLAPRIDGKSD